MFTDSMRSISLGLLHILDVLNIDEIFIDLKFNRWFASQWTNRSVGRSFKMLMVLVASNLSDEASGSTVF